MKSFNEINNAVIVENGLFEVHRDGTIYRNTKFGKRKCAINKTSRNGKYRAVTAMRNGEQKKFYVHRLIAQAFIPNPENKPQINHIDGNPSNNDIKNLEWVTAKENVVHAYKTGLASGFKATEQCISCENKTMNEDKICPRCKNKNKWKEIRERRNQQLIYSLDGVEFNILNENEKIAINYRRKAMTYEEIGKNMGLTKQRVEQIIKNSLAKSKDYKDENLVMRTTTTNYEPVSKNKLWNIRKSRGIHQKEMANFLNIKQSTYSNKERNPGRFKVSEAKKICEYFDLNLDDLF